MAEKIKEKNSQDDILNATLKEIRKQFGLCTFAEAVWGAHRPKDEKDINRAKKRFMFDDMFLFCFKVEQTNSGFDRKAPFLVEHWDCFKDIQENDKKTYNAFLRRITDYGTVRNGDFFSEKQYCLPLTQAEIDELPF